MIKDKKIKDFNINDLFLAGVHLGHHSKEWNPKMSPYMHSIQASQHIIDLEQTLPLLRRSMSFLKDLTSKGGQVLFVGTKSTEVSQIAKVAAQTSKQLHVTTRWVHGTFSNWNSIFRSIQELNEFEQRIQEISSNWFTRKGRELPPISELLSSSFSPSVRRRYKRLKYLFDGVKELQSLPSAIVILDDLNLHRQIIKEATRKQIAVIAILDSNTNPEGVQYPIPGNDDSLKSLHLYAKFLSKSCAEGSLLYSRLEDKK